VVFIQDEGGVFEAPIATVWAFVSSGDHHTAAHGHRRVRRRPRPGNAGQYSWEQEFLGRPERFTMRWTSYYPVGVAYDVLAGPFRGSRFFLYYLPRGRTTGVSVVGEFVSPTIPVRKLRSAVRRFFALEFAQDSAAIRRWGTTSA
jgi:hypothetical protein